MKRVMMLLCCFAWSGSAQTRRDDFDPADIVQTEATLLPLSDGGCSIRWCGEVTSGDGGVTLRACPDAVELTKTANRNTCLNALQLGEGKVLRALRFAVDAGAP